MEAAAAASQRGWAQVQRVMSWTIRAEDARPPACPGAGGDLAPHHIESSRISGLPYMAPHHGAVRDAQAM